MEWLYVGFIAFILALLVLDLGVFHRQAHVVKMREALTWSAVWISLGVAFSGFIYLGYEHHWLGLGTTVDTMATPVVGADGVAIYNDGGSAVVKYLTGFLVEKSLAVDNIFVIAMIFGFFAVPPIYQHRGAVLGHRRRAGDARRDDRGRRGADHALHLDHLRLRRLLDPDRREDVGDAGRRDRPERQPGRAPGPAADAGDRALPRRAVLRPRRHRGQPRAGGGRAGRSRSTGWSTWPSAARSWRRRCSWPCSWSSSPT
jgi:hypothetical protein